MFDVLERQPTDEEIDDAIVLVSNQIPSNDFERAAAIVANELMNLQDYFSRPRNYCNECGSDCTVMDEYQTAWGIEYDLHCGSCGGQDFSESPCEAIKSLNNQLDGLKDFLHEVIRCFDDNDQIITLWRETNGLLPDSTMWLKPSSLKEADRMVKEWQNEQQN